MPAMARVVLYHQVSLVVPFPGSPRLSGDEPSLDAVIRGVHRALPTRADSAWSEAMPQLEKPRLSRDTRSVQS